MQALSKKDDMIHEVWMCAIYTERIFAFRAILTIK